MLAVGGGVAEVLQPKSTFGEAADALLRPRWKEVVAKARHSRRRHGEGQDVRQADATEPQPGGRWTQQPRGVPAVEPAAAGTGRAALRLGKCDECKCKARSG